MKHTIVIAEAGVNHNGELQKAFELVDMSARAKVDFVKFQTFLTENLMTETAEKADYQKKQTGADKTQFEMIKAVELSKEDQKKVYNYAKEKGVGFTSSPFDLESADFLINELKLSLIKIPSGELTNSPLLLRIALSGTPVILSTGMATLGEVEQALGVLAFGYLNPNRSLFDPITSSEFKSAFSSKEGREVLKEKVSLLHCTTEYPAPFPEVNLNAMNTLKSCFGTKIGYSDHTKGISVPIAATALGAEVIEKHITTDKNLPGPDHSASIEEFELTQMVQSIREVDQALGNSYKGPTPSEVKNINVARKSIVASKPISKGETFSRDNITCKRPGGGASPIEFWDFLGKTATTDFNKDQVLTNE